LAARSAASLSRNMASRAEYRAGANGEVDPVQCDGFAEPLDQPFGNY
jgi:hypothetical protein